MPRLNTLGAAVCGVAGGQISVDGAIPSELSAAVGGNWGWLQTTIIAGQASLSGGAWVVHQDDLSTHTVTTLDTHAANAFGAGAGIWALWLAGTGVVSNLPGFTTQPTAGLGWVSRTGQVALINSRATSSGLTVYSASGAVLQALPSVSLVNQTVRLESDILAYQDASGWHLLNVLTGATPLWYPRTDAVLIVVPVMMGTTLCVVEAGNAPLTCRAADSAQGYTVDTHPTFFNPDGVSIVAGVVRMAYGANAAETPDSLLETDLTLATGATVQGTVVAGAIVRVPGPTLTAGPLQVGPQEGSNLTSTLYPPVQAPVVAATGGLMNPQWSAWARTVGDTVSTVSLAVQQMPVPPAPGPAFGLIAPPAPDPAIAAMTTTDVLTLTSADTTIGYAATPPTKTLDLHVVPQGPDTAVQTNQGGALSGDANFTYDPVKQTATVTSQAGDVESAVVAATTDGGVAALHPVSPDSAELTLGMVVTGGNYIPTGTSAAYLSEFAPAAAAGFEVNTGLTPGTANPFANGTGWQINGKGAGTDPNAIAAYAYGLGAGAVAGVSLIAERNSDGSGAAGTLGGEERGGTRWYIWQDATGAMRFGPARPTEDDSVSDTSGTLFGTGSGTVTHTGPLTAGELVYGNGSADVKVVAATDGQVPIGKTSDGTAALATLTAGTNITITNGPNSITINAPGGGSWIPLSLGVEPLTFVSDGAGRPIVVAF